MNFGLGLLAGLVLSAAIAIALFWLGHGAGTHNQSVETGLAELWDPATGTWSRAGEAPGRWRAPAPVGLSDGRVLILDDRGESATTLLWSAGKLLPAGHFGGGFADDSPLVATGGRVILLQTRAPPGEHRLPVWEAPDRWSTIPSPVAGRIETGLVLEDGRVLLVAPPEAGLWDVASGRFEPLPSPLGSSGASEYAPAVALGRGRALLLSRRSDEPRAQVWESGAWTLTKWSPGAAQSLLALDDGRVLLRGPDKAELWDLDRGTASPFIWPRELGDAPSTVAVPGGLLFAVGLADSSQPPPPCLLWKAADGSWAPAGSFSIPRRQPKLTRLPGGGVLALGGSVEVQVPNQSPGSKVLAVLALLGALALLGFLFFSPSMPGAAKPGLAVGMALGFAGAALFLFVLGSVRGSNGFP